MQDKCREKNIPLYVALIDLTMAFDKVSSIGLAKGHAGRAEHDQKFLDKI